MLLLDLNSNKKRCYELTAFFWDKGWNIFMKFVLIEQWKQGVWLTCMLNENVLTKPSRNPWNGKKHDEAGDWQRSNTTCHLWLDKTLDWPLLVTNIGKPTALCELTIFAAYIEFNTIPFWFPLPHRMSLLKEIACDNCVISILFTEEAWGRGNVDI